MFFQILSNLSKQKTMTKDTTFCYIFFQLFNKNLEKNNKNHGKLRLQAKAQGLPASPQRLVRGIAAAAAPRADAGELLQPLHQGRPPGSIPT